MSKPETYDAIVIGAGQGGGPLATRLAASGKRTAIIERQHVGGTCVNEGCTPTKTMIASARIAHLMRRAPEYGVQTGAIYVDMRKIRERKDEIVKSFRSGSQRAIESANGVTLLMGEARFTGAKTLAIRLHNGATKNIQAQQIFINTGTRPAKPKITGIDKIDALDSSSIMELNQIPEHLLVLGGGYVGLEFGQMFRRFGSKVTIVQRSRQLLPREDPDIAMAVKKILEEDGIEILLQTEATAVRRNGEQIELSVLNQQREEQVVGSHLLVAAGRTPNTDRLDPGATGVILDANGYVKVNERLETNVAGIYALGDVKGAPAFTHISYDDYRILRRNLLEEGTATTENRLVPYTVFIDPQLGRVGMTEREARAQKRKFRVAKMPMNRVARALEVDEPRGVMKAIVDADSEQILGAAILGIEGGEVATVLQMAMLGGVPYTAIRDGIFAHPTLAESLNNLFTSLD